MIEYIERSIVEKALQQAKHTMRVNENRGLSEAYIEAKSAAAAFQYVLDNLKPVINKKYEDIEIDAVKLHGAHAPGFTIEWSGSIGYGNLAFHIADYDVRIDHEMMSKEFVKTVLNKMVEKYYK